MNIDYTKLVICTLEITCFIFIVLVGIGVME